MASLPSRLKSSLPNSVSKKIDLLHSPLRRFGRVVLDSEISASTHCVPHQGSSSHLVLPCPAHHCDPVLPTIATPPCPSSSWSRLLCRYIQFESAEQKADWIPMLKLCSRKAEGAQPSPRPVSPAQASTLRTRSLVRPSRQPLLPLPTSKDITTLGYLFTKAM